MEGGSFKHGPREGRRHRFAREGADVLISYLNEDDDARYVQAAERKCVLVAGDLSDAAHCRAVVDRAVQEFGGIDRSTTPPTR